MKAGQLNYVDYNPENSPNTKERKTKQQNRLPRLLPCGERSGFPVSELDIWPDELHICMARAFTHLNHVYFMKHFLETLTYFLYLLVRIWVLIFFLLSFRERLANVWNRTCQFPILLLLLSCPFSICCGRLKA